MAVPVPALRFWPLARSRFVPVLGPSGLVLGLVDGCRAAGGPATLVVPVLFALTLQVVGSRQMATFAGSAGFATLVMTSFGGTRRDKAVAPIWAWRSPGRPWW